MIIDDLPSGSIWIFALNLLISFLFQLVGFLLTYLLHTSHAAKYGSRAGLGLTLIQFGFYSRSQGSGSDGGATPGPITPPPSPFPTGQPTNSSAPMPSESIPISGGISSREWISFILMTCGKWNELPLFSHPCLTSNCSAGWFILLSSGTGFWRVKHWESSIRSSNPSQATVEEIERDMAIRRNLEVAFGISLGGEGVTERDRQQHPASNSEEEEREMARNLREAGFL